MDTKGGQVDLVESYINYEPPFPVAPIIHDLLKCVPEKYLTGLDCIVLTNASGQPRHERRKKVPSRNHKTTLIDALGFYQPAPHGQKPYIELYVDNILANWRPPKGILERAARCYFSHSRFAKVLYHELGHHIHETKRPEHREPENVAETYTRQLMRRFRVRRAHILVFSVSAALISPRLWTRIVHLLRIAFMALCIRIGLGRKRESSELGGG